MHRTSSYADKGHCQRVVFNLCCQAIGQIKEVESCRNVIGRLLDKDMDAVGKGAMLPEA